MQATAIGTSLPISTKQSVEICSFIRGKTTEKSKMLLEQVQEKKIAVPYKKFNGDIGHKRGRIAAGRYPLKAIAEILKLIKSVEANADVKGLSTPLIIKEIMASQASRSWHHGRQRRIKTKRTHVKITVEEVKKPSKEKKPDVKGLEIEKGKAFQKKTKVKVTPPQKKETLNKK